MTEHERMDGLLRHINLVREHCSILAEKLADKGEVELARGLLKNSFLHDNSKFSGIEWQFLTDPNTTNRAGLKYAIEHHQRTNPHHPEYWGTIKEMPLIYRYEMIADITARGSEMATSSRDFINNHMPKRYGFPKDGEIHKQLVSILDMLCPQPFTPIESTETPIETIQNDTSNQRNDQQNSTTDRAPGQV
jgi:hypothetical protein